MRNAFIQEQQSQLTLYNCTALNITDKEKRNLLQWHRSHFACSNVWQYLEYAHNTFKTSWHNTVIHCSIKNVSETNIIYFFTFKIYSWIMCVSSCQRKNKRNNKMISIYNYKHPGQWGIKWACFDCKAFDHVTFSKFKPTITNKVHTK